MNNFKVGDMAIVVGCYTSMGTANIGKTVTLEAELIPGRLTKFSGKYFQADSQDVAWIVSGIDLTSRFCRNGVTVKATEGNQYAVVGEKHLMPLRGEKQIDRLAKEEHQNVKG